MSRAAMSSMQQSTAKDECDDLLCRLPRSAPALFAQPPATAAAPAAAAAAPALNVGSSAAAFAAAAQQHANQQALAGRLVSFHTCAALEALPDFSVSLCAGHECSASPRTSTLHPCIAW
jgi:anti-sigma factor RsiW